MYIFVECVCVVISSFLLCVKLVSGESEVICRHIRGCNFFFWKLEQTGRRMAHANAKCGIIV